MRIYLLVSSTSSTLPAIEVNGHSWSLQPFELDNSKNKAGFRYSCISYTWGSGRENSPFDPSLLVSDRTIPALQTFTQHRPSCSRIWVDAFCVPTAQPERAQTLESMGYIYTHSEEVLVVLSSAALPALTHMLKSSRLDVADLAVLEHEEWVERAWTYQETVNGETLLFSCQGDTSVLVPDILLFDCVGYALSSLSLSVLQKLRAYPRLNAFEDIIADSYTAAFQGRSALSVMSNMDRRIQERADDHFYAMIGAISADPSSLVEHAQASEVFMKVCEMKGDFSFIFSASKRDETPLRSWRPVPGELPSILPWHTWGSHQPGRLCSDGLWLDELLVFHPAEPQEKARSFVQTWLKHFWDDEIDPQEELEAAMVRTLRAMGFVGSPCCVSTATGYFFPFEPVMSEQVVQLLVSAIIRWSIGAPGLVSYKEKDSKRILYAPGVYFGPVEAATVKSVLLS